MDCCCRAEKLYSQGQYSQVIALAENYQYKDHDFGELKKFCGPILSSAVELKDYQKFKGLFDKIKNHLLEQYGVLRWIECLKHLLTNKKLPEFFIRQELIAVCRNSGRVAEFEEGCQNQMDRSIKKRRININVMAYGDFLGERVEIYHLLHKIYQGAYEEVTDKLRGFKNQFQSEKFQKIVHFIAANIDVEECKRIEIKEVIVSHLAKKRELETSCYKRDDVLSFEKAMIRNFINVVILDFENKGPIIDLVNFVVGTENRKLKEDLFQCLEKFQDIKEDDCFKRLQQECMIRPQCEKDASEDIKAQGVSYDDLLATHTSNPVEGKVTVVPFDDLGSRHRGTSEAYSGLARLSREILIEVAAQTDEWFIERFEKIIISLIGLNLYKLALESITRIRKINNGNINSVDIDYFEVEIHLLRRDYINAIRACHEALNQENLSSNDEICFEYLKGEAYFCSGEKLKAYKSFKKVFNVNPSYRLARERLKILEKSK